MGAGRVVFLETHVPWVCWVRENLHQFVSNRPTRALNVPASSETRAGLPCVQVPPRGEQGVQSFHRGTPKGGHARACGADNGGALCFPEGRVKRAITSIIPLACLIQLQFGSSLKAI